MGKELEKEKYVNAQTIGKYIYHLEQKNIIGRGDWIYFAINNNNGNYCKEITQKEYNKAWEMYFNYMDFEYCDRYGMMCHSIGGHPYKEVCNGLYKVDERIKNQKADSGSSGS